MARSTARNALALNKSVHEVPFRIIMGAINITGKQPDGDSVAFLPDSLSALKKIRRGYKIRPSKKNGTVQLRFEGIDAPELHFKQWYQPFGEASRNALLKRIGYHDVQYRIRNDSATATVLSSEPHTVRAWIATRSADKYGRPIALVFIGECPFLTNTVSPFALTHNILTRSLNYAMVRSGNAYPIVYTSMPTHIQKVMRSAYSFAKKNNAGLWKFDTSTAFPLLSRASVMGNGVHDKAVLIYPKLFRRIMGYFDDRDRLHSSGELPQPFDTWLRASGKNDAVLLPDNSASTLADCIEVRNNNVRFSVDPFSLTIIEQ